MSPAQSTNGRPTRVAILGGGIASLAAAFELSHPRHNGQFSVELYQIGWRLGGKCASGRDLDNNMRIKEHGPHLFFGFYNNAFALLRECYQELARPPGHPFRTIEDALVPKTDCTFMEEIDGKWVPWTLFLPEMPGSPGDDGVVNDHEVAIRALERLHKELERAILQVEGRFIGHIMRAVQSAKDALTHAISLAVSAAGFAAEQAEALGSNIEAAQKTIQEVWEQTASPDDALRRLFILADLIAATLRGALGDNLLFPSKLDLDAANRLDYREWLAKWGAHQVTIDSTIVRAMYDTVFAYPQGDITKPGNVEAGCAVRAQLDMASYRGAAYWKMRAGTADVTAAPLMQVLEKRGVKFHFFHRVDALVPSADGREIAEIRMTRQAQIRSGSYRPLMTCKGLEVWPDRPDLSQLVDSDRLVGIDFESGWNNWNPRDFVILQSGRDFDAVVLGISLGALTTICQPLAAASPAWREMLDKVKTVPTQSVQLWFNKSTPESGWTVEPDPVVSGFDVTAIDTWFDASDVIPFENWPASAPKQMAILCGPMPDPPHLPPPTDTGFPARMATEVANSGLAFLKTAAPFWPSLYSGTGFEWNALVAPATASGPQRFAKQYWVAGINPSDRYVQSFVDTGRFRLAPDQSGFDNLYLAGDWTDYGLNLGCFEGAVISGRLAGSAITGGPMPVRSISPVTAAGRSTGRPRYVEYNSTQTLPGPIDFGGVTISAFLLPANFEQLTRLCDGFFAIPTGGAVRFRPLLPFVVMGFTDIAEGRFVGHERRGFAAERELSFGIPGTWERFEDGQRVEDGLATFMPYLFLDNPVAMLAGRETYGYLKQFGKITLPADGGANAFAADVYGCEHFGIYQKWSNLPLVSLTQGSAVGSAARSGARMTAAEVIAAVFSGAPPLDAAGSGICDLLTGKMTTIFLKQFRDIEDGRNACYQAVAIADFKVTGLDDVGILPFGYQMQLHILDSTPVAADLGLGNPTVVGPGIEIKLSMRQENGRVLWQA